MTQPVVGLQTSIWNNNIKSMLLLAIYPFILGGVILSVVAAWGFFNGNGMVFENQNMVPTIGGAFHYAWFVTEQYWPMIFTAVLIWFMIAYFFQGAMIRSLSKSHSVTRKDEPELYNLVENMCIAQGMRIPRIEIIESHARNAFASGINEGTFCITVTRGLMQSLSKDELEGVLAHELTHIINRDVRLLMVCVIFTGMLGVATQLLWSNLRYSLYIPKTNNNNKGGSFLFLLILGIILAIGYGATLLARFAISRKREFMADAGAVQITKNPDAMMRALIRISGAADVPKMPDDVRAMCFENRHAFLGMFATHPPIAKRIQAISDYSGQPIPDLRPKISADQSDAFARPAEPGSRDNWLTRQRFAGRRNKNPWS